VNEILANFHFLRPWWLLAMLPAALLAWWLWRQLRSGQSWSSVIDPELLPHLIAGRGVQRSGLPLRAVAIAWLLAAIALAGPTWEKLPQPVQRKEDALVILYDMSQSMLAEDVSPSRLIRSRQKLLDLLQRRQEGTTALVAYAGDAHIVSPLTDDSRTIANLLPALEPRIMPLQGSRPQLAAELALGLLRDTGLDRGRVLLVTDGIGAADAGDIRDIFSGSGYRLSALGVGTGQGGPIPTGDGYLRDAEGTIVIAALDREPLRDLVSALGGYYSDLSLHDGDLDRVLSTEPLLDPATAQLLGRSVDTWADMGFWLLLLLAPVSLLAFRRGWLLVLLVLPWPEPALALGWEDLWLRPDQQAARQLQQGDPAAAAQRFSDPEWAAAAHYRAGEFEQAESLFSREDSARAWYNRGNSLARGGELEQAIAAYEQALQREPDMEDAAFNKQLLEQLQDQQQQQQNSDQSGEEPQDSEGSPGESGQQDGEESQDQQQPQGGQPEDGEQDEQRQQEKPDGEQPDEEPGQQDADKGEQPSDQNDQQPGDEARTAAAEARDMEAEERELANEQMLRRIQDDPSGLLRRKFLYESRQRAGERRDSDENVW